ncbi:AMIN-like domain-containing (lipo)protein [Pseudonocardia sp. GCM10023141]|uniref:AMIN-like domain-containing (lipo)protein n=1 Tax=Pseudonocardia sp. GCM10023141 TaxID=3252653 RepID=UPI00361F0691
MRNTMAPKRAARGGPWCLLAVMFTALVACSNPQPSAPSGAPPASPAPTTAATTSTATTSTAPPSAAPAPSSGTPATPAAPAPATCAETRGWTTAADAAPGSTTDELYAVRVGRHACYDRVVFDINGPAPVGFDVRYVPVVSSDPKGDPLPVAGGATLQVVVRAPEQGAGGGGHQPGRVLAGTGDDVFTASRLAGWPSLREVRFAGFFEGQCTFAIGVRAALPFRAFTLLGPDDQVRRVVVDVARG